jgi:hypothetical protein
MLNTYNDLCIGFRACGSMLFSVYKDDDVPAKMRQVKFFFFFYFFLFAEQPAATKIHANKFSILKKKAWQCIYAIILQKEKRHI